MSQVTYQTLHVSEGKCVDIHCVASVLRDVWARAPDQENSMQGCDKSLLACVRTYVRVAIRGGL